MDRSRGRAFPRWFLLTTLVGAGAALGCSVKDRDQQAGDATVLAASTSGRPVVPSVPSAPNAASPGAALAVDERGVVAFDQRWDHPSKDDRTLREAVARVSGSAASVRAARAAPYSWVAALLEALESSGATGVDVITAPPAASSSPDAGAQVVRFSPLGQVPMHEDRCGALVTIRANGTAQLRYLKAEKPFALPQGAEGPHIIPALSGLRQRMKDCESTLWMFAGEEGTRWGPLFDLGLAVSAEKGPAETRYVMLLDPTLKPTP